VNPTGDTETDVQQLFGNDRRMLYRMENIQRVAYAALYVGTAAVFALLVLSALFAFYLYTEANNVFFSTPDALLVIAPFCILLLFRRFFSPKDKGCVQGKDWYTSQDHGNGISNGTLTILSFIVILSFRFLPTSIILFPLSQCLFL
jgi:hypothetical protein